MTKPPILTLSGGVGGAKLVLGLSKIVPPKELVVIANTGDDETFHNLHVSPDLDTIMYTLAGMSNTDRGWGLDRETWNAQEMLLAYGTKPWFNLGDRDLATHIRRTDLLARKFTLSEVTKELCEHLGINQIVAPMSDDPIRTRIKTKNGVLSFQEYFVKYRCEPFVESINFSGSTIAVPSPIFLNSLKTARALIFCPSNPFLSVDPILSINGVRKAIIDFKGPKIAISPIVNGKAIKGPAAKLLLELGHEVSSIGIARYFSGLCDIFILDNNDSDNLNAIKNLGIEPRVTNTIMKTESEKIALAKFILSLIKKFDD